MGTEYTLLSVDNQACHIPLKICYNLSIMPVEFQEYTDAILDRAKVKAPVHKEPVTEAKVASKDYHPILKAMVSLRLAKNEDYAQLILLIISIILFGLAIFYGIRAYQDYTASVNVAPIDLDQLENN